MMYKNIWHLPKERREEECSGACGRGGDTQYILVMPVLLILLKLAWLLFEGKGISPNENLCAYTKAILLRRESYIDSHPNWSRNCK